MDYYGGYDPLRAASAKTGLKQQAGQAISQGITRLGEVAIGGIEQHKEGKREAEEARQTLAAAEEKRQQVIRLTRMAMEIDPESKDLLEEARASDAADLYPPLRNPKDAERYMKALDESLESVAIGLAESPGADPEKINSILKIPGWGQKVREALKGSLEQGQIGGAVSSALTDGVERFPRRPRPQRPEGAPVGQGEGEWGPDGPRPAEQIPGFNPPPEMQPGALRPQPSSREGFQQEVARTLPPGVDPAGNPQYEAAANTLPSRKEQTAEQQQQSRAAQQEQEAQQKRQMQEQEDRRRQEKHNAEVALAKVNLATIKGKVDSGLIEQSEFDLADAGVSKANENLIGAQEKYEEKRLAVHNAFNMKAGNKGFKEEHEWDDKYNVLREALPSLKLQVDHQKEGLALEQRIAELLTDTQFTTYAEARKQAQKEKNGVVRKHNVKPAAPPPRPAERAAVPVAGQPPASTGNTNAQLDADEIIRIYGDQ